MSAPVAAIDCGTNSIRLLIARWDEETGRLVDLERRMEIVRLGYGVDRTGRLDPEAVSRTLAATREYAELIAHHGAHDIRFVATSATRDASNREDFLDGVREILGIEVEVVPGDEEAELSFRGAVSTLPELPPGRRLVVDIGGGSTELVLGQDVPTHRISLDIGSVRLTERHLHSDPPTESEIDAARTDVDAQLDAASLAVPLDQVEQLVGVAGTVTTLTGVALGAVQYTPDLSHGAEIPAVTMLEHCEAVLRMTRSERGSLSIIHPGRIDVIGAGALIWERIIRRVMDVTPVTRTWTSEHDILDGIALSLLDRG